MGFSPDLRILADAKRATRSQREELFRETSMDMLQRWILGAAWTLKPSRAIGLPALAQMWLTDLAVGDRRLPDPRQALTRPPGLCGIVHDLSVPTLVEAHRRGLFTFAHFGPLKWMSPPERCVLNFEDFHMSKRLRSRLRQSRFRVTFDRDFERVIKACAGRRSGKWHLTWITPQIMHAYCDLHDAGYAHSFEVWNADGALVGGGYGMAVGGAFTIESQFTLESNTSKIGFAVLNWHLAKWGFLLNDNKGPTRNTLEMGFEVVPRAVFHSRLAEAARMPDRRGKWEAEAELPTVAQWQPAIDTTASDAMPPSPPLAPRSDRSRTGAALLPVVGMLGSERMALAEAFCALL
jgi:leucyl/phenylalanyl-tRNA---protein transferase